MRHVYPYHFVKTAGNVPYQVVVVQAPWRRLPPLLHAFREVPLDIRKAHMDRSTATIYLKPLDRLYMNDDEKEDTAQVRRILDAGVELERPGSGASAVRLPRETEVSIFNVSTVPYTILEFRCPDRVGLMHDLFELMAAMPYEIEAAYVSTDLANRAAHNLLYLTRGRGHEREKLGHTDMEYVRHVFEYDAKERLP